MTIIRDIKTLTKDIRKFFEGDNPPTIMFDDYLYINHYGNKTNQTLSLLNKIDSMLERDYGMRVDDVGSSKIFLKELDG